MNHPLRIGITDCGKFENYRRWIESVPGSEVVKLSMHLQNAADSPTCDGIIFSGGEDVHPGLYGRPEYVEEYGLKEIIPARDLFEYAVIESTLNLEKPVLAICRGLQLINIFLGGSLVPDIPTLFHSSGHGKVSGIDQVHDIEVETGSLLYNICGRETGIVNSAHHQSADRPADALTISAYSEPNIVEAMEWKDQANKSWLLMVQWHPERMADPLSPFSASIRDAFLGASSASKRQSG